MAVPLIVILPGLIGLAVLPEKLVPESALQPGQHSYNDVLPLMLARYCGPVLMGLGVTALVSGFMAWHGGPMSGSLRHRMDLRHLSSIYSAKPRRDAHYVSMGRWCTIIGLFISIGTAYLAMGFASIMDYVQALFSFFIAPLFGTVLLGMLWKRAHTIRRIPGPVGGNAYSNRHFSLDEVGSRPGGSICAVSHGQGAGARYVPGIVVLPGLRRRNRRGQLSHDAKPAAGVGRAGIRLHADSERRKRAAAP